MGGLILGGSLDTVGLGAHVDGGEGALLTKLVQGELVPVPVQNLHGYMVYLQKAGSDAKSVLEDYSPTGVPGALIMTAPTTSNETVQSGVSFRARVYGRRIGIMFQGRSDLDALVTVLVNREVFFAGRIGPRQDGQLLEPALNLTDDILAVPVAEDLPDDGPHTLIVQLNPDPAVEMKATIHALLLERRMGYVTQQRAMDQRTGVSLTTAFQSIPSGAKGNYVGIHFLNQDAKEHTVTLQDTVLGLIEVKKVSAESDWVWLPAGGQPVTWGGVLQAKADEAGKVKATPMAGA